MTSVRNSVNPPPQCTLQSVMRLLSLALLFALAAPLSADELLNRLAADDPQVREKAQRELRDLPPREIEGLAEQAKDPEAVLGRNILVTKEEVTRLLEVLSRFGSTLSILAGAPPQSPPFQ